MAKVDIAYRDYYSEKGRPTPVKEWEPRYRWTVERFLGDCRGKRVLEVGCGAGGLLTVVAEGGAEVRGVDVAESGIAACQEAAIAAVRLDVSTENLPFDNEYFDFVICLETLEHLTNPYHALDEIRRVLRAEGHFVCSVPNPRTGHAFIYPGLFEYANFSRFLSQSGFQILRVEPWQWVPRELVVPRLLRRFRFLKSRYVVGVIRRLVAYTCRRVGWFPYWSYWLWTFDCAKRGAFQDIVLRQAIETRPGRL